MLPGPGLWWGQGPAHGWKCLDGGNAGTMEGRQVLILPPSPSSLSSSYVIPHQARCPPLQCPCCAVAAWGENPVPFLGALRNQSLRFLNSQQPLEKIYGVTAAFEDFRLSDGCPKPHTWFLRFLNRPGLLASSPFPVDCSLAHLSSPLHEMHWVSAPGSKTP